MILDLTKDNLQKCGFDNEEILKLLEWDNYAVSFFIKDTWYYATNIENLIYTEIDAYKKINIVNGTISFPLSFPELIPDYFDLAMNDFLENQKKLLKSMFVEEDQKKNFVLNEIENKKNSIKVYKQDLINRPNFHAELNKNAIAILESYIDLLNIKLQQPQQPQPEVLDLSDTMAIDKILYLQKLGVIDFLRLKQPFSTSVNSLATILSAITGEKTGTLQPMLNPMLSKKVDDTNNPFNSKNAVGRVEKLLIHIGFNLNGTN